MLRRAKLVRMQMLEVAIVEATFRECDAKSINCHQSRLFDADWSESDISHAQFYHTRIQSCRFRAVVGEGANFAGSRIEHCDFTRSQLEQARFLRTELAHCSFRGAHLASCDFRDARLRGSDFSDAVLDGARFGNAQLSMADFRGASLRGVREITAEQLSRALTDHQTVLPNGSRGPYLRFSGAERFR